MQDYSIAKSSRKCSVSGQVLEPGQSYISAITSQGEEVKRIDIAASEWKEPGENIIGWWRCRMPDAKSAKLKPAPNGVLLDTLAELLEKPGKESLAYVLAVLLVRRRVLSEEQSLELDEDLEDATSWTLVCSADDRQWNVPLMDPSPEEILRLQEELNGLLFTEE